MLLSRVLLFSSCVQADWSIRLVDVKHDGYCFYHAVTHLLPGNETGSQLYQRLRKFISSASAVSHPHLENLLHNELIGSSIYKLTDQMINHPPSLSERSGWAGYPEVVALHFMLQQPILVIHVDAALQVSGDSFLINSTGVHPLDTLADSQHELPLIQLVITGSEWFVIEQDENSGQWAGDINAYINRLSSILNDQLSTSYCVCDEEQSGSHWRVSSGAETVRENMVMLEYGSLPTMHRIEFSGRWQQLIKKYAEMKSAFSQIQAEAEYIHAPDFQWQEGRYDILTSTIDGISAIFLGGFVQGVIGPLLQDYLSVLRMGLRELLESITPSIRELWRVLSIIKPSVDKIAKSCGGLSFAATCSSSYNTLQMAGQTSTSQFNLQQLVNPILPSGETNPNVIRVSPGAKIITYDSGNPLHHILFALYITAKSYSMADQCLRLSRQMNPRELARVLGIDNGRAAMRVTESQQQQYSALTLRITALVHALGRHYYPDVWKTDHYQAITICDQRFIVFHSDDFQPRGGWQDLLPPEYQNTQPTKSDWEEVPTGDDTPLPPTHDTDWEWEWEIISDTEEDISEDAPTDDQ